MRKLSCALALGLIGASGVFAGAPAVVYLTGPSDLARLRDANPRHYAQAERVLGAAGKLCRPAPGDTTYVRQDFGSGLSVRDLSCTRAVLKTSNPPKFDLRFKLDSTLYVATVTVTDDPPRAIPASASTKRPLSTTQRPATP